RGTADGVATLGAAVTAGLGAALGVTAAARGAPLATGVASWPCEESIQTVAAAAQPRTRAVTAAPRHGSGRIGAATGCGAISGSGSGRPSRSKAGSSPR